MAKQEWHKTYGKIIHEILNSNLIFCVVNMKMRFIMLSIITVNHFYDNIVKSA